MNYFEKRRLKKEQKRLEKRKKDIMLARNISALWCCIIAFTLIMSGKFLMAIFFFLFGVSITTYFEAFLKQKNENIKKPTRIVISIFLFIMIIVVTPFGNSEEITTNEPNLTETSKSIKEKDSVKEISNGNEKIDIQLEEKENTKDSTNDNATHITNNVTDKAILNENEYKIIEVSACDLSGNRQANVKVDIGYGEREYWAYTNEYGQLIKVEAKEIILQDNSTEDVNFNGRYCDDNAKVPGAEEPDLDEGHVIADSLGGVSNAYNITPQNSTLNRHGNQAYMEEVIRQAGGCTDFEAIITYPDTENQIPSHYKYTYTINGEVIVDEFDNISPDNINLDDINNAVVDNDLSRSNISESANANVGNNDTIIPIQSNVWIPASGSKYHSKPSCGTMKPETAVEVTKSEAESMGYTACKRCY